MVQSLAFPRSIRRVLTLGTIAICAVGCGTTPTMTPDHLASIGVVDGAMYWEAEQKLATEGYQCFVAGAKREHFECTKTTGFFPSCLLRVEFIADDKNQVSHLRAANPACMGTP
jgi:hypothetical protein